eukprot:GEMP01015309.1.p1 GENE.GEMP01015309.1~~GEMP01015309.1.p1  ORF type:complete len:730 (+),score=137.47 GEMP01015309.1:80-2269(+)
MVDDDAKPRQVAVQDEFTKRKVLDESRRLARRACFQLACFMTFLFVFTVVQLVAQTTDTSLFAQNVREHFNGNESLDDVVSEVTWYRYVRESFLPRAFFFQTTRLEIAPVRGDLSDLSEIDRWFLAPASPSSFPIPNPNGLGAIDQSNYLLGAVRLRQYRVSADEDCIGGQLFAHFRTSCYQGFTTSNAVVSDVVAAGSGGSGGENAAGDSGSSLTRNQVGPFGVLEESPPFNGIITSYGTKAFYIDFTSLEEALTELDSMVNRKYIDTGTRALLLDFTIYNPNLDQFAVTRVTWEFGPSGIVKPAIHVSILRRGYMGPFVFDTTIDMISSVGDFLILVFLIYYMVEELSELSVSRWDYLNDGWNYMDWMNMILLALAYAYRIKVFLSFADVGEEIGAAQLKDITTFKDFQIEASDASTARMLNSFNSVLLWIKFVKYVEFMPYVQFLYVTVSQIMIKYFSFLFMFIILIMGFIHAFTLGFGELLSNMVSFDTTAVALLRTFLGDVDFLPVYREAPGFGAFLILTFYVMVVLVGLNVFFAIIASGISDNKVSSVNLEEDIRHIAMRDAYQQAMGFFQSTLETILRESPSLYRRFYKRKIAAARAELAASSPKAIGDKKRLKRGKSYRGNGMKSPTGSTSDGMGGSRQSSIARYRVNKITDYSTTELCNAADEMAGRLLTRIETANVEIKVEILRMKESVEEMVTVTKVLGERMQQIVTEQVNFLESYLA